MAFLEQEIQFKEEEIAELIKRDKYWLLRALQKEFFRSITELPSTYFAITEDALIELRIAGLPRPVLKKLEEIKDQYFLKKEFLDIIGPIDKEMAPIFKSFFWEQVKQVEISYRRTKRSLEYNRDESVPRILVAAYWFVDNLKPLLRKLCTQWNYCERKSNPYYSNEIKMISAISDIISTVWPGFNTTALAVLLYKLNLGTLCRCNDKNAGEMYGAPTILLSNWLKKNNNEKENIVYDFIYLLWIENTSKIVRERDYKTGRPWLKKAFKHDRLPDQADAQMLDDYAWYILQLEKDNYKDAIRAAKKASKFDDKNPAKWDTLGWGHFRNDDYDKSIEILEKALALEEKLSTSRDELETKRLFAIQYHLACGYYMVSNFEMVKKIYKKMQNTKTDGELGNLWLRKLERDLGFDLREKGNE